VVGNLHLLSGMNGKKKRGDFRKKRCVRGGVDRIMGTVCFEASKTHQEDKRICQREKEHAEKKGEEKNEFSVNSQETLIQ